ncbi:MAG: response regulator transcription factor [Ruminococcaceae bacterium]|nr:response regulator transcription factor [Oscillospiraceae bacterium]
MENINVLIADNEPEISSYFMRMIQKEPGMNCIGRAASGREAVEMAWELHPHIILMDVQMESEYDGITAIEELSEKNPEIKCIAITIHRRDDYLFRAYAAGAVDYILKTDPGETIIRSIREVYYNVYSIRPEVANKLMQECKRVEGIRKSTNYLMSCMFKLTNSELIVLRMFYFGASPDEIAKERFIDIDSVKTIVKRIQRKYDGENIRRIISRLRSDRVFEQFPFLNDI